MTNEAILNKRWKYSNAKLKEYLNFYKKINKRTQDKIQDILNGIKFTYLDINKPTSKAQKDKLVRVIDEWREKGLLNDYFGYKVDNLIKKSNITNEEMLDILIYGTFIEERHELDKKEKILFIEISKDIYKQAINDIKPKKKKKWSLTWEYIWFLLTIPNSRGHIWIEFIQALSLTNYQQIKQQVMINLQQGKKLDIDDDVFQNILNKQRNYYLSINDDKYSGSLDSQIVELGNAAYLKAGKDTNQKKCRFVSDLCPRVTDMCMNMNNYIFNIEDWNEFDRYIGENKSSLKWTRVKIFGLVSGINLPPIIHHIHYCHSTITYQVD